jgi:hypothetical protein
MKIKRDLVRIWLLFTVMLPATVQAQFLFVSSNNVITITGYTGPGGSVVIPKKINGLPVTIIGTSALSSLSNLTSVTLPDNVASIYSQAFYNCTGLTNVTLGNGVTTIGDYAFEYCTNLSNVTIPAGLQSLGNYAFAYCASLNGAYFQGNAPTVSVTSFASDPHAIVYYLPWTTGWGQTFGGVTNASYVPPVPFNYTTNNGAITITGYTGSNSLETVPSAIYVTGISKFLPVTSFGTNAFAGCSNLISVSIPNSVTNLGSNAFSGCSNLIAVFFSSNAPSADATVFLNDDNVFVYCLPGTTGWSSLFAGVQTVQLPYIYTITNGTIAIRNYTGSGGAVAIPGTVGGLPVVSIGNGAFAFCGGLTSITMPDSVSDLGIYAFYACSNLAEATISTNVTIIGTSAFDSCTSLTNVNIPDGVAIIGGSAFQNCASLGSVIIPNGVIKIGGTAFQNCASLASVSIPASVRDIGQGSASLRGIGLDAFGACDSLLAITVDPQNTNYSSLDGVLLNMTQNTLIQYPGGKAGNYTGPNSWIGDFAFDSCAGLTGVVISNYNANIGDWAFAGCSGLTSVTIVNSQITIGSYAFESCSSLKDVNLSIFGSSVSIGSHVFDNCPSLADVTIGSGLTSFSSRNWSGIFSDCPSLTSIYLAGSSPLFTWNPTNAVATPTAYYLPWANLTNVSGLPTALWLPRIQNSDANFGFQANQFGFNINWAGGMTMVVEACADLANPVWTSLGTNTIAGTFASGSIYFSDPQWTNYTGRFYRIRGTNAP